MNGIDPVGADTWACKACGYDSHAGTDECVFCGADQ